MPRRFRILVCRGPECGDRRGSASVYDRFHDVLRARGLLGAVTLGRQSCFGRCTLGPNVLVREVAGSSADSPEQPAFAAPPPDGRRVTALYNGVGPQHVGDIVDEHVVGGRVLERLIRRPSWTTVGVPRSTPRLAPAAFSRDANTETETDTDTSRDGESAAD